MLKTRAAGPELNLKIKLQGDYGNIVNPPIKAVVSLYTAEAKIKEFADQSLIQENQNIFSIKLPLSDIDLTKIYAVFIKPEKYLGRLFCSQTIVGPDCHSPQLIFSNNQNDIDLSEYIFLSGDLKPFDGKVSSYDLSIIIHNLGKTANPSADTDINFDGYTDTQDYSLALYSLKQNAVDDPINITSLSVTPTPTVPVTPTQPTATSTPTPIQTPIVTPSPSITPYPITKDEDNMIYTTSSCKVEYKEVPIFDALAKTIVQLCQDNYLKIAQKLNNDKFQLPISMSFSNTQGGAGTTSGSNIVLSSAWFTQHPDDMGAIIHEMTHTVQAYPSYFPSWLIEGIADYIRYWMGYQSNTSYAHCVAGKNYTSGYWCSAAFLQYLEKTYDKDIVTKLDAVLREGNYNDSLFTTYTGKDLPTLWNECRSKDCVGGSE